jgi:predicted metalloprotease
MRWQGGRESDNVEDERSASGGGGGLGGRGVKLGLGGIVVVAAAYFLGIDPRIVLGLMEATQSGQGTAQPAAPVPASQQDEGYKFVSVVLAQTEDVWSEIFKAGGAQYEPPKLVLFRDGIQSACGAAQTSSGPFYCPGDEKLYIDLAFYDQLAREFKAPGDFAQAYVIAHEVGHHVQLLLGTERKLRAAQERAASAEAVNQLQVRMELQADCYAGIWANRVERTQKIMEPGDLEEAIRAAAAVGDDTIQRRTRGYVVPESFTHGSAEQRMTWFRRGFDAGQVQACDTFSGA